MNTALLLAAGLLVAIGFAHSYLGERYILIRLFRRTDLPKLFGSDFYTRRTLRFAWHITTVAWLGFAALLVAAATRHSEAMALSTVGVIVGGTFLVSFLLAASGSRGKHYSWAVFLAVAILAWIGTH